MLHMLSTSVLWEHLTVRGSVNTSRVCYVFEVFHSRHYFLLPIGASIIFYGCILLIQKLWHVSESPPETYFCTTGVIKHRLMLAPKCMTRFYHFAAKVNILFLWQWDYKYYLTYAWLTSFNRLRITNISAKRPRIWGSLSSLLCVIVLHIGTSTFWVPTR